MTVLTDGPDSVQLADERRDAPDNVARHEAGHVLAARLLGLRVTYVTIDPERPFTRIPTLGAQVVNLDRAVDQIAVVAMGHVVTADPLGGLGGAVVDGLGDDDAVVMAKLAQTRVKTAEEIKLTVELGKARARGLIDTPEFERAFPPLVAALLEHGSLNEVSIDVIVEHALASGPSNPGTPAAT